jgi:serine/threonine protein kinase, bacterial
LGVWIVAVRALLLRPGLEPFPGYQLDRQIGSGGWSEVWKARRPDGTPCALKFMECRRDEMPAIEVRALHALHAVKHTHLLAIENIWSCPGYIVISMDLADGSLLDLLQVYLAEVQAAMAPEHVCHYLSQAAEGLDYLNTRHHQCQGQRVAFRHCDIKPANLLVFGAQVRIADFSLAVQVTSPMCPHRRMGTLHYSAPEIFQGWLSDKSDQFSLAVTYYQLRTGRLPFLDTPSRFTSSYVRPAPELDLVSAAEQEVLERALAPVPQARWPSCREMMQNIRAGVGARQPAGVR